MTMRLKAANAVLKVGLLFDVNVAPREMGVPPELNVDIFERLTVSVNAPVEGGVEPRALVSLDAPLIYYAHRVRNNVLVEDVTIRGSVAESPVDIPHAGFVLIDRGRLAVPEITGVVCPVNTRVTIDIAPGDFPAMQGFIVTGRRRGFAEAPYASPAMLKRLTQVIAPGTTQIDIRLPEFMTILHKYQFSVMALATGGGIIYSGRYIDLIPGGNVVQGAFAST